MASATSRKGSGAEKFPLPVVSGTPAFPPPALAPVSIADEEEEGAAVTEEVVVVEKSAAKEGKEFKPSLLEIEDKLDLAGLLNVLDGVVDTPNRIIIMTTNREHPPLLSPLPPSSLPSSPPCLPTSSAHSHLSPRRSGEARPRPHPAGANQQKDINGLPLPRAGAPMHAPYGSSAPQ